MSGHIQNTKICSSCAEPVHVSVCSFPTDYSFSETLWCVGGRALVRLSSWQDGVQVITWQNSDGTAAAPAPNDVAQATPGACAQDFEIVERFVCAAGVTLVRQERFSAGNSIGVTFYGINGAAVAAPAAFNEGSCDDQDLDIESEQVCASGVTLTRRRVSDAETGALVSETFIGANGATVAAPAAYTQGSCTVADIEIKHDAACAAGVQVLREQVWTNGTLTATNWFGANGAVIAAPAVYTWGACPGGGASDTEIVERFVCATGTTLVQRTVFTNGVAAAPTYFGVNGAAVAAPAAFTEGACDDQDIDLEVEYVCAAGVTLVRRRIVDGETGVLVSETFSGTNGAAVAAPAAYTMGHCSGFGTYAVLRCGATSNVTTTANVQATRVVLENDVILTKSCPTTSALANNVVTLVPNGTGGGSAGVPANARGVTVYNVSRQRINFNIASHGTVVIPPNGTWSGNLPDNVPPYSGAWTVSNNAGNSGPAVFGINPHVIVDWVTRP
jgi:hypothetical protein